MISLEEATQHILKTSLEAVNPERLIRTTMHRDGAYLDLIGRNGQANIILRNFSRIFMIAMGKAAPYMAFPFLDILGEKINKGAVICLPDISFSWPGIDHLEAPHPFPDERSLKASEYTLKLAGEIRPGDLVFFLISGGASAQLSYPLPPATLREKTEVVRALMNAGADIKELNIVRKHLSRVKGGRLGAAFEPATLINLFISDVIDDDLETIASAPTTWDSSTFGEAEKILKRFKLWNNCSPAIKQIIEQGKRGEIAETRKKDEVVPEKLLNFIIGNNEVALEEAARAAENLGFKAVMISRRETGEAREMARVWASLARSIVSGQPELRQPLAILSGGELTVTVRGKGKGGRNTEISLALLKEFQENPLPGEVEWSFASLATDGRDGPTKAAGAIVSGAKLAQIEKEGLIPQKYLEENDSFTFMERVGGLLITGVTKTNVMDIRLMLLRRKS